MMLTVRGLMVGGCVLVALLLAREASLGNALTVKLPRAPATAASAARPVLVEPFTNQGC